MTLGLHAKMAMPGLQRFPWNLFLIVYKLYSKKCLFSITLPRKFDCKISKLLSKTHFRRLCEITRKMRHFRNIFFFIHISKKYKYCGILPNYKYTKFACNDFYSPLEILLYSTMKRICQKKDRGKQRFSLFLTQKLRVALKLGPI